MKQFLKFVIIVVLFLYSTDLAVAGTPIQNNSSYITPSSPAASDGTASETIKIHLQDINQTNVVNAVVTLSSSNNTTAKFPQNDQMTDANGDATFTVTSTTPGTTMLTLFDSTNNVTFADWFSITFYDAEKGCVNIPPAPVLTSVVSNSDNTATLTWIDSPNPVNNYLISYGLSSKNYSYGNPNIGPQGTVTYKVGSLAGGKSYYFVVSANNNCGTSGFSNEISVVVKPVPSTPGPLPKPTSSPKLSTIPPTIPATVYVTEDTPSPTEIPQGTLVSNSKETIRNWGIGIISVGVLLVIIAFVVQKINDKNKIPMLSDTASVEQTILQDETVIPQKPIDPLNNS